MKNFSVLLFLFCSLISFAQKDKSITSEIKVTSVSYTVDTIEELKTIDWKNIKEAFENNKPEEIIELNFGINLKESKYKVKSSIKISGESRNLDSLFFKAKKGVKSLIKISNKYKNK
ncbi:hypothetical protein H9I45_13085 [Polaribacter haliotis]|uniref:Uncharacterized protein n=1 Tax=Polaribacter haliotis TaxID=1888915 RepID=A0A7L8AE33_9FLAO|nr:hypothetical protein [Polaribacter haliotis]QOD60268.1 hypothetical protein H9I45_13085 [Polaribacter haliotis]